MATMTTEHGISMGGKGGAINTRETNTIGRILKKIIIRGISFYYLSKQGDKSDTQSTKDNSDVRCMSQWSKYES